MIKFIIIFQFLNIGFVAIDDISVAHQTCQQTDPNLFRCNFEGNHTCGFTPTYDTTLYRLNWNIYKGSDTSIQTYDHTLKTLFGHYYALDFNVLKKNDMTTTSNYQIVSKEFPPTRQTCVTFSYFMYGLVRNESLNFYTKSSSSFTMVPKWSAFGSFNKFWYSHRMTISSTLNWKIGFDVTTHNSDTGLIAVDDVIVELNKPCPPKGFCDFEVVYCRNYQDHSYLKLYLINVILLIPEERHLHVGEYTTLNNQGSVHYQERVGKLWS